jgi:hypothetical protein
VTGYTPEQERGAALLRLDARKAAIDERAATVLTRMRAVGYPAREDFASRAAYRAAVAKFRRK